MTGVAKEEESIRERAAWIFQSTPDRYDLSSAVSELSELAWLVNQAARQIHSEDRAYLWETGPAAGIVAVGTILTEPAIIAENEAESRFWRRPHEFTGPRLRVRISIDRLVQPRLLRNEFRGDPVLDKLPNLRFGNATNYRLTPEQERALTRRLDGTGGNVSAAHRRRVVKIAPGRKAQFWEQCREGGYICVGWDQVGDLHQFPTKEAYRTEFARHYRYDGNASTVSKKANELWTLIELQPGDLIVANQGLDRILAVGTVIPPGYEYRPELGEVPHVVRVNWDESHARNVQGMERWFGETVRELTLEQVAQILPDLTEPGVATASSDSRQYFIAMLGVDYPGTWERTKELGQWGSRGLDRIGRSVRPGDRGVIRLGRAGFKAVVEFTSEVHQVVPTTENEWGHPDRTYPYRYDIKVLAEYEDLYNPSFPGGENVELGLKTAALRRSLVPVPKETFERIVDELERMNAQDDARHAWVVLQRPGSSYGDVEGEAYHYPGHINNARRVSVGDWLIVVRPANVSPDRRRLIVGCGRVGEIETGASEDEGFHARYGEYHHVDPAVSFEDIGAQQHPATQQSITPIPMAAVDALLKLLEERRDGPDEAPTFEWLVERTLWTEDDLHEIVDAWTTSSRQIVLAGPPGTGKTWVAKALAAYVTGGRRGSVTTVQFHPSYTYEQFVEGLRPVLEDGAIQFQVVRGPVLRVASEAADGKRRVVLMDEMNRANLPKVLGELMYLFEYRDEPIDLQYSRGFKLPKDVLFIGTMNTADRSIRSIDVALRRRFDVFECKPDQGILERYYAAFASNEVPDLLVGFEKLNESLTKELDRHHTIGHAFFMADPMTPERLRHVWKHKIGPLIEEYFFDRPDLAAEFAPATFWPSLG